MPMKPRLLTIGYEGLTPDELISITKDLRAILMDVRSRPAGRVKRGFSRSDLHSALGDSYQWHGLTLGGLGQTIKREGLEAININLRNSNVLLMCMEEEPCDCHRHFSICRVHYPSALHIFQGDLYTARACAKSEDEGGSPVSIAGSLADLTAKIKLSTE